MAQILFIHRDGPGQFVHLAAHLAARGYRVTMISESVAAPVEGVEMISHRPVGSRAAEGASSADYQLRMGVEVAGAMEALGKAKGAPDLIVGHGGWGGLLFAKDVFPSAPVLGYCEFFYRAKGADVGFDPAAPPDFPTIRKLKGRNFAQVTTLLDIEGGISPTQWQRSLYPAELRSRIAVIHDGIDTGFSRPDPRARFALPGGRVLEAGDKVVTFAARNLEPYRGFPQFMRAAARLARRCSDTVFVVAGGDGTTYGAPHPQGRPWRHAMVEETGIDPGRIHFVGTLAHSDLVTLFQVSAAHVYLSYPFVLSWSMLEAMACGALLVGSATPPVQEFVEHGRNGLLVPFFDPESLAATLDAALKRGARLQPLREAARATVLERADLKDCLSRQVRLLSGLAGEKKGWCRGG